MLLHEAIADVLRRNGNRPMHADGIAAQVNTRELYHREDGQPVPRKQVVARMVRYSHVFERTSPGYYRLR